MAKTLMLVGIMTLASVVQADIRALIEYDQTQHRLVKVVELKAKKAVPLSDHIARNAAGVDIGHYFGSQGVKVIWLTQDGTVLKTDSMADPRFTHAPLNTDESRPSVIGLDVGAYVVDGPSGSAFVEIRLPANAGLGIGAQSWRFALTT